MGISISIPCDPCINRFFQWFDEKVARTHNLKKNLAVLEKAIRELKARREDLLGRVKIQEDRGLQRLAEVQSLRSSYRYGRKVILTLREVEKQLLNPVFGVVAEQPQTSVVQKRQLDPIIVGQEAMFDKAWKHLMEDEVGIMGMHGLGGVGKTTLLTQLNNKFTTERCGFDYVIWVVVSRELNLEKIQDEIAHTVGLGGEEWKQKKKSQKVDIIFNFLSKKKFVLFQDDMWEKVDLVEIGVPFPTKENKCKVAFTTRSKDVCAYMRVEKPMEVQCLTEDEAFDLFQKKVGETTLGIDPEIPDLARIIAKKCCGLPLALSVIGETMSCKKKIHEWHYAIKVLNEYASKFSGMEDKILPILKYSYDNLEEDEVKSCLLYCALFPEDYKITQKFLVDYWIGQGFINGSEGMERAEDEGYEIIAKLVRASLLMEGVNLLGSVCVYMHDVVREMALWIASDLGKQKEAFIVRAGVGLRGMPKVKNWNVVRRMSLLENDIRHLVGRPECLELTTLLLYSTNLEKISSEFFNSMPKLTVLDLSGNGKLSELPGGISDLLSLQYLNLSYSGIRHLPMDGKGLKKLIYLDLAETQISSLVGISNLSSLKVLDLSGFSWDLMTVSELETLEHLEVLTVGFEKHPPSLELYLNSHRLVSCTRYLKVSDIDLGPAGGISFPVIMEKLRGFIIEGCSIFEIKMVYNLRNSCFLSLSSVQIQSCEFLRELTFLMFAPNLELLEVMDSPQLEDIINKEKACEVEESGIVPFPKLISLQMINLPELKSIYWRPLPFPCLKEMEVFTCPNLKKLPLKSQSGMHGENGLIIKHRPEEWIEGVEWEDEATKTRFLSSCARY